MILEPMTLICYDNYRCFFCFCQSVKQPKRTGNHPCPFFLKLCGFGRFELKLELIGDEGDKLAVCGLALGRVNSIPKEFLQSIQVASVPSYLDSMADSPLYPAGGSLEGFGNLGIEHLGDGVDGVPTAHQTATAATGFVDDL